MKQCHKPNFYCWSHFNPDRNIDFHSYLWIRPTGNVVVDPLPLSEHDSQHLQSFGHVSLILLSNSDHIRDAEDLAQVSGAPVWGPAAEKQSFPFVCDRWLQDNEQALPDLRVFALQGSKTPGELAFLMEGDTLVTGDLIRAHQGGSLCLLPDPKLSDKSLAMASVHRLAALPGIQAVLPGDGWPVFREGGRALQELAARLT